MRWQALFADLSAELDAAEAADLAAEVRERVHAELARVALLDRLRSAVGRELVVVTAGGEQVHGELVRAGADWLLFSTPTGDAIVPVGALRQATRVPIAVVPPDVIAARLSFGSALRRLARERRPVWVVCRDGTRLHGTVDRAGADFVDLAEHAPGEPRREHAVRALWTMPFDAIAVVRSAG